MFDRGVEKCDSDIIPKVMHCLFSFLIQLRIKWINEDTDFSTRCDYTVKIHSPSPLRDPQEKPFTKKFLSERVGVVIYSWDLIRLYTL